MYSFPYLEPVCCSMSNSNYCFLTCIQVSQEAGQVVWYSYLFQNFPHFTVIHTVKGFGMVSKSEINIFLKLSCNSESHKQTIGSVDRHFLQSGSQWPYAHIRSGIWLLNDKIITRTLSVLGTRVFPGDTSGKEPTCQCRRCKRSRFNP